MQRLEEHTWQAFRLGDIADIRSGRDIYAGERRSGDTPYVTSGTANNGIGYFVANYNDSITSNAISVNRNGSIGEAFYHPYPALYGNDCRRVILRDYTDAGIQLFIAHAISMQKQAFSYSRKLGSKRLTNLRIMLPVNSSGAPDDEYMEKYAQQKQKAMLLKYGAYAEQQITKIGSYVKVPKLNEKEWAPFKLTNIFEEISRGKRLKKADHVPGQLPYVSSTASNNGIDDYIEASAGTRVFRNCISLANSGSVGTAFYEPFNYVASDHVTALKTAQSSKYTSLFMATVIAKQKSNFNFNREINDIRVHNMRIMLPVNDSGEPDYEYMEQYTKNMMLRKYEQYLTFLEGKTRN
ncbi:Type II specificity (S) subunit of unknown recognition sequence [Bifidobacterium actinocoloniiforme DSM 22766]|uniref:Type I restriction modification DNA specificity domain-containing protein n=1 Tax=Bifidobacterium actinocoloniiforme DSM 22766 TaxID=1437605 RepID=A0A086Z1M8_9BIFI|nr:restriction endonuclease subunit S [Bifidobacterium actinocoloniiforme]KFI40428.1 Type II specificity (S) subunit of unknown recognition sequence [Bifidobacterium actinocoloniiforme DSM 22766]